MNWIKVVSEHKIVFFVGSLNSGGLERFVTSISIELLKKSSIIPVVICLEKKEGIFLKKLEQSGIKVLNAPRGWQRKLLSFWKLRQLIKSIHPDIVHSQVNFSLIQQWLSCFGMGVRFFVTERNMYPLRGFGRLRRIVQFYFLRLMKVNYSANSQEVAAHLARQVFFSNRKIPVIPNGINLPVLDPVMRLNSRSRLGFNQEDFVIGYVARFAAHKGHSYFVKVMKEVYNRLGDRLKICFVGDGPLRKEIETQIVELNLNHITFFVGIVDNPESYYLSFDCLALLSEYEGMPNVVLEGMAYGLPVVANPVGNVNELLADGCGVINYSDNPVETAVHFMDLANNQSLREDYGMRSRTRVHQKYSLQNTLNILCSEYGIS